MDAINAGDTVSVDFDTGVITDETNGKVFHAEPSRRSFRRSSPPVD